MAQQESRQKTGGGLAQLADELPTDRLKGQVRNLATAYAEKAMRSALDRAESTTERLTDYANSADGGPGLMAALTGAKNVAEGKSGATGLLKGAVKGVGQKIKGAVTGGGGKGGSTKVKVVNIVEDIDVGLPLREAYNQWTQFQDWSGFMKKVHGVEQKSDEKMGFDAQVFWSHRSWEATVVEQVPDDHIVWTSTGEKGRVDGTVTFHEIAPRLTRILVVLEYHPQGLFERTGNLWRAQGRRARLELKHFRRHAMRQSILEPDEVEGWRGEIRDSEVVLTHEEALDREQDEDEDEDEADETADEVDDEDLDEEAPADEEPDEDEDEEPEEEERRPAASRG